VDLVLLDIEMPESAVLMHCKNYVTLLAAELPIIMVTAKAQSDDIVKAWTWAQMII